jgi:hypothetical protein
LCTQWKGLNEKVIFDTNFLLPSKLCFCKTCVDTSKQNYCEKYEFVRYEVLLEDSPEILAAAQKAT